MNIINIITTVVGNDKVYPVVVYSKINVCMSKAKTSVYYFFV